VGEATGALDSMLEKIADFYDEEVDAAVAALTSMLEPLLMLFLGGSIGGLVIAMYCPSLGWRQPWEAKQVTMASSAPSAFLAQSCSDAFKN